jgi:hypothetical protein
MFAAKELLNSACRLPQIDQETGSGIPSRNHQGQRLLKNGMLYAVIPGGQRSAAIKLSPSLIEERGTRRHVAHNGDRRTDCGVEAQIA